MVAIIGRYRLPMVPVMSLYAAVLLTAVGRWARERRWLPPLAAFWAFSALLGFAFHESPLVKEMKQERMAEACHRLARIHQTEGRPVEALETTQRAIDWFPEAAELYLIPGLPYERMNPYQLTWARRKANVDHRLAPSDDMVTCARILEEGGSPEWAEKVLRRAFVFYRHSDVVLGELLGVLWRQGKRDAMEELLERTSYSNPKSPAAAYFRALTEPGGSDKGFFLPASGFEAVHSAEIEFRNGRFVQACRLLQVAWQGGFAHSAEANYLLARCWSEIGDLGKATEHLKLAAELSPDYVRLAQYEGELIQLKAASRAEDPAHRERLAQAYLSGWRIRDFAEVQKWERPPGVEAVFPRLKASDADFEPIR
jgi:tetratricopeptide (TPR) repeat protein